MTVAKGGRYRIVRLRASLLNRPWLIKLAICFVAALLVVIAVVCGADLSAWTKRVAAELQAAGPWVFFGAMALLPAAGFPISLFNVAAGPAFGGELGLGPVVLFAALAITFNVTLTYWLGRTVLRPPVVWLIRRMGYRVPEVKPENQLAVTIAVRVTPGPPFFLQSYILGLAQVRFGMYLLVSSLVSSAYSAAVIVLGDAIMKGRLKTALWAAAALGVIALVVRWLRKSSAKKAAV